MKYTNNDILVVVPLRGSEGNKSQCMYLPIWTALIHQQTHLWMWIPYYCMPLPMDLKLMTFSRKTRDQDIRGVWRRVNLVHGPPSCLCPLTTVPVLEEAEPLQNIGRRHHSCHHSPFVHLSHLYIDDLPALTQKNIKPKLLKHAPLPSLSTSQNFGKKSRSEEAWWLRWII